MISRDEVLMGREKEYPLTPELEANLGQLLTAVNMLRSRYGIPMKVSSGYRPGKYNVAAGGAPNSSHMSCQAVDFVDVDGMLKKYLANNPGLLEECGLYQEDPMRTPTWVHVQIRKPVSGSRIFKP